MNRSMGPLAGVIIVGVLLLAGGLVYWQMTANKNPNQQAVNQPKQPPAPQQGRNQSVASGSFEEGKAAPEISGVDLDNKPIKLSDYRGKIVLLDFWGFW